MGRRKRQVCINLSKLGFSIQFDNRAITVLLGFISIWYCPEGRGTEIYIERLGDKLRSFYFT